MKYIPNSFQVSNAFVDEAMRHLGGNAVKCYNIIVRKTTGWGKEMDYISISQFMEFSGIKKAETVTQALKELEQFGLIERLERAGYVTGYRLTQSQPTPKNGGTATPENGGETPPEKRVHPKTDTTPKKRGYPPPKNGGTTTPENGGTTKPTTKPTKQNININAPAVADAPKSAGVESQKMKRNKTTQPKAEKASELDLLLANGVNQATAQDYLQTRKSKRAGTLTQTALNGIIREAKKAGLSLEQALTVCCERSWIGFNAQWLHNTMFGNPVAQPFNKINQTPVHTQGGVFLASEIFK